MKKNLSDAVAFAKQYLADHGELQTMFVAFRENDEPSVFLCPFRNDEEKLSVMRLMNVALIVGGFDQYVGMHEAWMSRDAINGTRPSECSDRQEVLMISSVTADGSEKIARIIPFDRDENGTIHFKDEQEVAGMAGAMMELFKPLPAGLAPDVREFALEFIKKVGKKVVFH